MQGTVRGRPYDMRYLGARAIRARIIQRPERLDIKIAKRAGRAAPRTLHCALLPPRARNANRVRAAIPFRAAHREIAPRPARCEALPAYRCPARCGGVAQRAWTSQNDESPTGSTKARATARRSS